MIAQSNLEGRFTATVIFRHEGDAQNPLQPETFEGSYAEVMSWMAAQQVSEYPVSSASVRLIDSPARSAAETPGTIASACAFGWGA